MRVLVIGAGNMGLTYSEGMSKSPLLNKHKLRIYDTDPKKIETLRKNDAFNVFENLESCLPLADLVFIAVKPYHSDDLFSEMKSMINDQQIFVSLMAGVTIQSIQERLQAKKVIRTMPNLPAQLVKA